MLQVAPLHDEHCSIDVHVPDLKPTAEIDAETVYLVVSEKHGDENTGYLVVDLAPTEFADYWCGCDDFRYNRVEKGEVVGECKHCRAVKKRTREATEPDQATLTGGGA